MQAMFGGLKHRLVAAPPILSRTVSGFIAEGTIAAGLGALQDRYPQLEIGSYPVLPPGQVRRQLRAARHRCRGDRERRGGALKTLIRDLGAEPMEVEPI